MKTPQPEQTVLNDHSKEDDITRLLVGFANDLLAYSDRQTKHGNDILFIHDYVARRKKKFEQLIKTEAQAALNRQALATALRLIGDDLLPDVQLGSNSYVYSAAAEATNKYKAELRQAFTDYYGITDEGEI